MWTKGKARVKRKVEGSPSGLTENNDGDLILHPESNLPDLFLVLGKLMEQPIDPNFKPFTIQYPNIPFEEEGKE